MFRKKKLIKKVNRLIKKLELPIWMHHFGPKTYKFRDHLLALLVKEECKLGFRRVSWILNGLGIKCPSYSALCKFKSRVDLNTWQRLLQASISSKAKIVAIDGSGLSRPLPSPYYYKRIDKPYPIDIPIKCSIAVDVESKQILGIRIRSKLVHDVKDVKYLLKRLPNIPEIFVADKGYDANWIHQLCVELGIQAHIPIRKYGKSRHKNYSARQKATKHFNKQIYNLRNNVESIFSAIKRKFGASVSSIDFRNKRAEVYARAIIHNISFLILGLFQRCRNLCEEKVLAL